MISDVHSRILSLLESPRVGYIEEKLQPVADGDRAGRSSRRGKPVFSLLSVSVSESNTLHHLNRAFMQQEWD